MEQLHATHLEIGDPETRIRLVAQGKNLWKVRMLFPKHRATEIPEQLRQIKTELALSFGIAERRLEYLQLLSKKHVKNGILVELQIRREAVPSGAVRVRFLPMEAPDGTQYSDMQALVDLFPLDDYERELTFETVEAKLRSEGIDSGVVNWKTLRHLVQECVDRQASLYDQVIAEGELPDVGNSSRLYYSWFPQSDAARATAWLGLRPVEKGEDFLEHQLPVSGLKSGRNVLGRELSPRKGNATRLEAGRSVSIGGSERKFVARESGVIFFRRTFSDKRTKDSPCETPTVLHAEIRRIRSENPDAAVMQKWDEDLWVNGSLEADSQLLVSGDCIVYGDIPNGCQVQVGKSLRVYGDVGEAVIGTGHHLCVHGKMTNSVCEVGLTAQLVGTATDCAIYAREILADSLVGGAAEAYTQITATHEAVFFNREKFLAEQREAGEDALATLRRQFARLYEIFGAEIVQQVHEESVQMHLLRWIRKQKSLGNGGYTHPQVQEFRTLLEILPGLRREISAVAAELRESNPFS